jgi:tetratricopeptide (TPR) repeat protein
LLAVVLFLPAASIRAAAPTFHRDIAPLLHAHCAVCHRPGQAAPFSLLTFADAQKRAADLVAVTQRRVMPPWLPGPASPEFLGARRLSDAEVDTLRRWAEAGAPEGDPAAAISAPVFPEGWRLGAPDLVAEMPAAFTLGAEGPDEYRFFLLPVTLDGPRVVGAVEFAFDNPRVVHHAVLLVDRTPSARELDARDPAPGFGGLMVAGNAGPPDGRFLGWTPGRAPVPYAPGEGWRLAPGHDLVLQLHLRRTGRPEPVRARVGLHFTETPPHGRLYTLLLRDRAVAVPAGATNAAARDAFRLPVAAEVLAVAPHAHFLARDLRAEAALPGGATRTLLHIPDWDFHWQDEYRLKEPVALPAGTELRFRYTFDNSAANPRNPSRPPRDVAYGRNATDEMAELLVTLLTTAPADVAVLRAAGAERALREDLARHLTRLRDSPADTRAMKYAALRHQQLGENDAALELLAEAVRREPDQAEGRLLFGEALLEAGRFADAAEQLGRALELAPGRPEIRLAWARLLATDAAPTRRDPQAAGQLAREVIAQAGDRLPAAWEVLALALAAGGDAAGAGEAAARALSLAEARGDAALAARVRRAFPQTDAAGAGR